MQFRRMSQSSQFALMAVMATTAGLLIGWADIHNALYMLLEIGIYMLANAVLGYMRPKQLWFWPFIFTFLLYAAHVWAIRHGYKPPFVERNEAAADACFFAYPVCLLGGIIGGGVRFFKTVTVTS